MTGTAAGSPVIRRPWDLLVAVGCAAAAWAMLRYFQANGIAPILWPASGLALATLLIGGEARIVGVFVGILGGAWLGGLPAAEALALATGNAVEALVGVRVLRWLGFDALLASERDYLRLALAAAICCLLAALVVVAAEWQTHILDTSQARHRMTTWWMADVLGILLTTPLLLVFRQSPAETLRRRPLEALAFAALTLAGGQVVFLGWARETLGPFALGYWMFLFVAWGAIRFDRHGVLFVLAATTLQALTGASANVGFFGADVQKAGLFNFWFYMSVLTVVGIALATAIDDLRGAAAQLAAKSDALARANADLTRFAEVSAHHLQEPARRLQTYAQRLDASLLGRLDRDDEARLALGYIVRDSERLKRLLGDIERFLAAGIPRGPLVMNDPTLALADAERRLAAVLGAGNGTVEAGALPGAMLDRPRLTDLFELLIGNALVHARPGIVPLVRVGGERARGGSRYWVEDNGPGIAAEYRERVFRLFERLGPAREEGSGIGLSIAQRIVASRNGDIHIETSASGGTRVVFELPDRS